jgi:hypothetical protein
MSFIGDCRNWGVIGAIDEWVIEKFLTDENSSRCNCYISNIWFVPRTFFGTLYYRVFVRGRCALFGCDELGDYGGGGYLPDDCYEWWCPRCGAEGINHAVFSRRLFCGDDRLYDFWEALRGR